MPLTAEYEAMAETKRSQRKERIESLLKLPDSQRPSEKRVVNFIEKSGLLTTEELTITDCSATELLNAIKTRRWTSLQVVSAFCRRAALAHQLVNCITEPLFTQAMKRAEELDKQFAATGELVGSLHGLPISVKDEFDLEGVQTTLCLVSRANCRVAKKTSPNIKILVDAGAIPICKTTTPIGAFNIETFSNLFGVTKNPYNLELSPGGSTGGEAALIALKGSPLGVGSDLGGSIRQPASFHGLFGLRMGTLRTTHSNPEAVVFGMESLKGTNGPLARDLNTVELYAESIVKEAWKKDINTINKPWTKVERKSLVLAVLYDDAKIEPTKPIAVALRVTVRALEKAGHTVLTWTKKELLQEIAFYADEFMGSHGYRRIVDSVDVSGEDVPGIEDMRKSKELTATEIWDLQQSRTHYVNKFWGEWLRLGIDGLITPVSAFAGVKFGEFLDQTYSPLANVLDVPACTFPVMMVDDALLQKRGHTKTKLFSEEDRMVQDRFVEDDVRGMYAGLQVLGPRLGEELVIEIVRTIGECLSMN